MKDKRIEIIKAFIDEILFTKDLAKLAGVTSNDAGVSAQVRPRRDDKGLY